MYLVFLVIKVHTCLNSRLTETQTEICSDILESQKKNIEVELLTPADLPDLSNTTNTSHRFLLGWVAYKHFEYNHLKPHRCSRRHLPTSIARVKD